MPLTNTQYDEIMRKYNRIQSRHQQLLQAHQNEIRALLPRVAEINHEISDASMKKARELLTGSTSDWSLEDTIQALAEERQALLLAHGYPADYLELSYDCALCRDTGYIGGKKCECFKRAAIELLYAQSQLSDILEKENFDTFKEDFYPRELKDEATGQSALDMARSAVRTARDFAAHFDKQFENLYFYGNTGVGKTFLTHCIARELIESGHSVIYFSAYDLFDELAKKAFHSRDEGPGLPDYVGDCDLLIIDDLGTELTNSFVSARLFLLINERLTRRKSTIISTNLEIGAFSEMYSERTFSRIFSNYTICKLIGRDIRIQKKLS
ncbi:MAG TPA: DNA replication protein DnaC [Lachnospiraceae bacterium]|nr:DNA replication protein DnaC [Lachnospiraceae bacterium]